MWTRPVSNSLEGGSFLATSGSMPAFPTNKSPAAARFRGFSLIELVTALAIMGILAALTVGSFSSIQGIVGRRSMVTDLYSALSVARARARLTERAQIVVIDAAKGNNGTFGFYHFEDGTPTPTLFNASQLNTLMGLMTDPPNVPAGYTLTLRDQRTSLYNGFYLNVDSWDGPLPFPWSPLGTVKLNSTAGCSFCTGGYGAVGFMPSGRAVFSDNNALGGFIVISGDTTGAGTAVRSGIGISPLGFIQQVEHP
jgi:prepilin-type N-terminal cleavage/methylation domain-containing protein